MRFYNDEEAWTVKRWLHRIAADNSGLTFEAWDPSADELDPDAQPAFMIVNSSEVRGVATLGRAANAELQEIPPKVLKGVAVVSSSGVVASRTRAAGGATVKDPIEILGPSFYAVRPDMDNSWQESCE